MAVLASGSGTNAENIALFFKDRDSAEVSVIITNRKDAYVLERARKLGVHSAVFPRTAFADGDEVLAFLEQMQIDFIILAGFLLLIPEKLLKAYRGRIVNIHPALLPAYGGKGMYGMRVHQEVIANGEKESGISIHHVNPVYDEGEIIFQAKCPVEPKDTPESLAAKIHHLEYEHYPRVIEQLIQGKP